MTQIATAGASPSKFWTFSLSVYRREGVPPACLTLQDEAGVDVNVLLFCLWLGRNGRKLGVADVRKIAQAIEPWRAGIVVKLREARRALKEPPAPFEGPAVENLRKSVKAAELESERIQQEMLFVTFPVETTGETVADTGLACSANVAAYASCRGAHFDEQAVATLIAAASATDIKG